MSRGTDIAETIRRAGRQPLNPIGQCFESAIRQVLFGRNPPNAKLCHGIGVATAPGIQGKVMGHAWMEADWPDGRRACDTTWGTCMDAGAYRRHLQLEHVLEFTPRQALFLWGLFDMPGPWDLRIRAITDRVRVPP